MERKMYIASYSPEKGWKNNGWREEIDFKVFGYLEKYQMLIDVWDGGEDRREYYQDCEITSIHPSPFVSDLIESDGVGKFVRFRKILVQI